jgi:hypothetical protein
VALRERGHNGRLARRCTRPEASGEAAGKPVTASAPAVAPKPVDVKVVSLPAAAPAEVEISNFPAADDSGKDVAKGTWQLVGATWVTGIATLLAVVVALVVAGTQSRDTRRRDRDAMMREVSRSGHEVIAHAERNRLSVDAVIQNYERLTGKADAHAARHEVMKRARDERIGVLDKIVEDAIFVVTDDTDDADITARLSKLSMSQLTAHLWKLDRSKVRLDDMSKIVGSELDVLDREISRRRQRDDAEMARIMSRG